MQELLYAPQAPVGGDFTVLAKASILFVDDDPALRLTAERILAPLAGELRFAVDGREAMYSYHRFKPDILVLDLVMPRMDGLALAETIREEDEDTPILFITADVSSDLAARALEIGGAKMLYKPIDWRRAPRVLEATAKDVFKRREAESQRDMSAMLLANLPFPSLLLRANDLTVAAANDMCRGLDVRIGEKAPEALVTPGLLESFVQARQTWKLLPNRAEERDVRAYGRIWDVSLAEAAPGLLLCCAVDVTERSRMQKKLDEKAGLLGAALENMSQGIVMIDALGRVEAVNQRFFELLGVAEDAAGDTYAECVHAALRLCPAGRGALFEAAASLEREAVEIEIDGAGGLLMRHEPLQQGGFVQTFTDVSDRVKLEKLKADVERITRHDLKAPLTAIIGLPQLVLETAELDAGTRETLGLIVDGGRRMLTMINQSLDLYKMEAGTYTALRAPVDLGRLLEHEIKVISHAPMVRDKKLVVEIGERCESAVVEGDASLLCTLFANVLQNALEASPDGGRVTLGLAGDETAVWVWVENQGETPAAIRPRLFEKYVTSGKPGGTGLGAYSARLVAENHGGTIRLCSDRPGMTRIEVRLPRKAAEA